MTLIAAGGGSVGERIAGSLVVVALVGIGLRLAPSPVRGWIVTMPVVGRAAVLAVAAAVIVGRIGIEIRPECYAGSDGGYRAMRTVAMILALAAIGCALAALGRRRWITPLLVTPVGLIVLLAAVVGETCVE